MLKHTENLKEWLLYILSKKWVLFKKKKNVKPENSRVTSLKNWRNYSIKC